MKRLTAMERVEGRCWMGLAALKRPRRSICFQGFVSLVFEDLGGSESELYEKVKVADLNKCVKMIVPVRSLRQACSSTSTKQRN